MMHPVIFGKMSSVIHQLYCSYGIHLTIADVLYKKQMLKSMQTLIEMNKTVILKMKNGNDDFCELT